MKSHALTFFIPVFLISFSCTSNPAVEIFNGEDLSNWTKFVADSAADPDAVFRVADGVIKVSGTPTGYIRTREAYSDYRLHLEWRWTAEPANSGVLLHVSGEDRIWPNAIECQLASGNAGDIVLMGEGAGISINDSTIMVNVEEGRYKPIGKFEDSSEKPAGEWNAYDITSNGDEIEILVNGVLQNRGSSMYPSSGQIVLQSEGGPIEFRNIYLIPLK